MEVLYVREPRRTSGARYHSVTTYDRWYEHACATFQISMRSQTHLVRESVYRNAESSRKTKVTQLQLSLPIDEQILRLEIPMEYPILVTERGALQELIHEASHSHRVESSTIAVSVHVFLEVSVAEFEDEDELCFGVNDIV